MHGNFRIIFGCRWSRSSLLSIAIIGLLQLSLSGCDDSQNTTKQPSPQTSLTMGTSADMPPFEFYRTGDGGTQIVGYDIDLAQAIGKELRDNVQIKDMDFSSLIPSCELDVSISSCPQ